MKWPTCPPTYVDVTVHKSTLTNGYESNLTNDRECQGGDGIVLPHPVRGALVLDGTECLQDRRSSMSSLPSRKDDEGLDLRREGSLIMQGSSADGT